MKKRKNIVIENSSKIPFNSEKTILISYRKTLIEKIIYHKKISKF